MNILIDIGHPAQVHNFKHPAKIFKERGNNVLFSAKEKEITIGLLQKYALDYTIVGRSRKGLLNKVLFIPIVCYLFLKVVRAYKPDIIISRGSFQASWISWLLRIPHVSLSDTEHVGLADKITVPFVDTKLTAYSYQKDLGRNHIRYNGNIELFYLHPNRFKPDVSIYKDLGITESEKFAIVRFVSWDAHHDVGEQGFMLSEKEEIIKKISKRMRVFVTSEGMLPESLKPFRISISPEKMHDALAFASLYVGEGGTMASEAALLGTPAIYVNTLIVGYVEEEAEHGLVSSFRDINGVHACLDQLLGVDDIKQKFTLKRDRFIASKIDPTAFLVWFVENYPRSREIMKSNSDYQYQFR